VRFGVTKFGFHLSDFAAAGTNRNCVRDCVPRRDQSENFSPRSNISMIACIRLARVSAVFAVCSRYATE
jgi:hypothetical protein